MSNNKKDLLKKVKALADAGVGGEKIAAEAKLKKLMAKFNITDADLDENAKDWYDFKIKKDKYLNRLFYQILYSIYDVDKNNVHVIKNTKYQISLYLPANIAIELEAKYDFYCKAFNNDLDTFYVAFVRTNKLFDCAEDSYLDYDSLSDEQKQKYRKATLISNGLDMHNYNKQIENTKKGQ